MAIIGRRKFIAALGGAAVAWPLAALAQQAGKVPRVGMVYPGPEAAAPTRVEAVMNGLRAAGYEVPAQVELVLRVTGGDPARITPLVAEIIASKVDVFLAFGLPIVLAVRAASQTVPIVAIDLESDPVDSGLAASLAHPGGNVTGLYLAFPDFATKWLELLKETIPQLSRVAVLWEPSSGAMQKNAVEHAAGLLKITPEILEVKSPSDFDEAFDAASDGTAPAVRRASPSRPGSPLNRSHR